jgi:hypothetical protein
MKGKMKYIKPDYCLVAFTLCFRNRVIIIIYIAKLFLTIK